MIDIKIIRETPEIVRKSLERRHSDFPLDKLVSVDKKWRENLQQMEKLKALRNTVSLEIAKKKDDSKIKEMKKVNEDIKRLEAEVDELEAEEKTLMLALPNILHESVPDGTGEADNAEVRKWGEPKKLGFPIKDHVDLGASLDIIDIERAAKVAGARFYYLKNDLVRLNYSIMMFALNELAEKGYCPIEPPYMLSRKAIEGAVILSAFEDTIYKIDKEDLYLIGTSEHAIAAMHMDEMLGNLPLKYAGISPCFRKEAGAHGKDTKGIFRVHQFDKVEQFIFCKPKDSWKYHEELINNAEDLLKKLEIPHRTIVLCSADTGMVAAKTYDFEYWMPAQGKYREGGSDSNCTDYQARRLNIKYEEAGKREFVHTLNSTAIATQRALVAILENNQQKDGSVLIPEVLQEYMGKKAIKRK
jgi:seryl-tRNA synthetase